MLACSGHKRQKFSDNKSVWRPLDVLAVSPPAEVVGPLDVRIEAFEQGYVLHQERPRLCLRNVLLVDFFIALVEML